MEIHYRMHDSPPLVPILSQTNPVQNLTPYVFRIFLRLVLSSRLFP